jgi:hypothetical protein
VPRKESDPLPPRPLHPSVAQAHPCLHVWAGVNQACIAAHPATPSDCIFAQHTLPHIQTPLFILQSVFDSWQLQWEHGHTQNTTALNAYGARLTQSLASAVALRRREAPSNSSVGGFVERCYHHCTTLDLWTTAPRLQHNTQGGAFAAWYASGGAQPILWQLGRLPCVACGCPAGMVGPA